MTTETKITLTIKPKALRGGARLVTYKPDQEVEARRRFSFESQKDENQAVKLEKLERTILEEIQR